MLDRGAFLLLEVGLIAVLLSCAEEVSYVSTRTGAADGGGDDDGNGDGDGDGDRNRDSGGDDDDNGDGGRHDGSVGPTACSAPLPTGFCFASGDDDFIGMGELVVLSGEADEIAVEGDGATVVIAAGDWWMTIGAPQGDRLLAGRSYERTHRLGRGEAPVLSVSGAGRGCNTSTGSFSLSEFELDHNGHVIRIAATFLQYCDANESALSGVLNYAARGVAEPFQGDLEDCEVPLPTGFCVTGPVGSHANGSTISLSSEHGTLEGTELDEKLLVDFNSTQPERPWYFNFTVAEGMSLAVGAYDVPAGPTDNQILVSGCTTEQTGNFTVLEITSGAPGENVSRLAIDFEVECEGLSTFGKLRIDSQLP